ncbi:MAG TPA: NUDIX domain-containing protein [Candidatus Saccharimonadales bacterium]|nr:NUDIX domain-containing protein [Candidatus Saccharimonadales bacterium]
MRRAARAIIIKDNKLLVTRRDKFGMQYYILVGGGVDFGESLEQALFRELDEETGVTVRNPRLVFIEEAGEIYGTQHIYLCEYVDGEPMLRSDSLEAQISAMGKNLYEPMWLPLADLATVTFRSPALQRAILHAVNNGWPEKPIDITASH